MNLTIKLLLERLIAIIVEIALERLEKHGVDVPRT